MKRNLYTAVVYTAVTAVLLGILYPLALTAIARLFFHAQANGQLITREGQITGSALLGQPFTSAAYFHSRPSAAGLGYDAAASSGSNYGPTNKALVDRVAESVRSESSGAPVPVDLVTASASGLDPDITPDAAFYQVDRVAKARSMNSETLRTLVRGHITQRQFGLLGEPRVNVLQLNLDLDKTTPRHE